MTSNRRKILLSVLLGLLGFASSFLSPTFQFPPHTVSITWFHVFPLLAAMAFGPRYGLLAGTVGLAAFHPFFAWPANGWANIVPTGFEILFYVWHGYWAQERRRTANWWNHPLCAQAPFALVYAAAILVFYPLLFRLNPPFWTATAASSMTLNVMVEIIIKTTVTMYGCVLLATFVLLTPGACRWLGVIRPPSAGFNGKIFLTSIASMISVWFMWQMLNSIFVKADFPQGLVRINNSSEVITLLTLVITCLVGGYVVTSFVERRYSMEESLRESEAKLRAIFDSSMDAIGLSKKGVHVFANLAYLKLFGYQSNEAIAGTSILNHIAPAHRQQMLSNVERRAAGEDVPTFYETRGLRSGGIEFDMELSVATYELQGEIYSVATIRDITDRKQAERALAREKRFVEAIFAALPGTAYVIGEDGRFVRWNANYREKRGWSDDDMRTMAPLGTVSPGDRARVAQALRDVFLKGHSEVEAAALNKNGQEIPYYSSAVRMEADGKRYAVGIGIDISERVRAEEALKLTQHAVDHSPVAVFRTSLEGRTEYANAAACRSLGYTQEELHGLTVSDYAPNWPRAEWPARPAPERGTGVTTIESMHRRKDGTIFPVEITSSYFEYATRGYFVCFVTDLTERQRHQALLVESEKLRTVAGLAAGVAHEINNPLGSMVQNAQVIGNRLLQDLAANQEAASRCGISFGAVRGYVQAREIPQMLDSIRQAGARASQIVRNLLTYSHRDGGSARVDLRELVEQSLALAASDYELQQQNGLAGVELVRQFAADTPVIACNQGQFQQVLLNLIRNAVQALRELPASGHPRLCLRTGQLAGWGVLEVEDNGPGISPELRTRLFEPFFTTKPVGQGTGLGLFVCHHIVTVTHGGQIAVSSTPGVKTCFTIRLPRNENLGAA